jgi:ATP-dependent Clp protease ATP-binding subunit ClpA
MIKTKDILQEFTKDGYSLSKKALQTIEIALKLARKSGRGYPGEEHLFLALVDSGSIVNVLMEDYPGADKYLGQVKKYSKMIYYMGTPPNAEPIFELAKQAAKNEQRSMVNCLDLLLGYITGPLESQKHMDLAELMQMNTAMNFVELWERTKKIAASAPYIDNPEYL